MPNIANELVYRLNQAIIADDLTTIVDLLNQLTEETINDYDLNDLLIKQRPIDCAVTFGTPLVVKLICDKKAKLNEHCISTGRCPIHTAMSRKSHGEYRASFLQIFEILYLAGADFRTKEKGTEFSLVHIAINEGKDQFIDVLVKRCSCDVNAFDAENRTPLTFAKRKFARNEELADRLSALGGKEFNASTAELYSRLNKSSESYANYLSKYAYRRPLRLDQGELNQEGPNQTSSSFDTYAESLLKKPSLLTAHSLLQPEESRAQLNNITVETHAKAILNGVSAGMYSVYMKKLARQEDKIALIEAIVDYCESMKETAKKLPLYEARVAELLKLSAEITLDGPKEAPDAPKEAPDDQQKTPATNSDPQPEPPAEVKISRPAP